MILPSKLERKIIRTQIKVDNFIVNELNINPLFYFSFVKIPVVFISAITLGLLAFHRVESVATTVYQYYEKRVCSQDYNLPVEQKPIKYIVPRLITPYEFNKLEESFSNKF